MHVAFVSFETLEHRESETNRRFREVVEGICDGGHDVHVFCAQFWAGEESIYERGGITYHAVSTGLDARASFLLRLPFVLASARPDVIHASATPPGQVIAANWGSRLARCPFVLEWYGDGGVAEDRLTRWATSQPDRIVTPSELVGTWVQETGAETEQVTPIPNRIDTDLIRDVVPAAQVEVVYARRLDEGANLESLLLALAEIRQRGWNAVVIGDGPERERYEELASDLRIDDRVRFAGECSREERVAVYRGAHVFAQTAERCVFPTEMLWALASGCVGIVEYHADSSAHELVEGWDRGFRTTSEQELTNAIISAGDLEYRDFDDRFTAFDRSAIRDQYLELYRTLQDQSGVL
ncbi:glycosyl transferase family 1 [Halostagnicola sp. A56]|uniref:glycosyltransferase family 4 protein n=1 Tax=Halostagnicola sp. A56 TaxID=1495067 RepID=UPI0004A00B57|nr:glycosyltransferase family 4 protein [Halostagnicola sp. A56]KDE59878.1 glycosyl transferase family 1 [Halostagnicola sp. A56]